jgi:hypothetical protein
MNFVSDLLVEYVFPLLMIAAMVAGGLWVWRTRESRGPQSPVSAIIAYSQDHALAALMLAASIALSVVSFWNTWAGMTDILGNPLVSILATIGVQGLMLVFAWKLGFDLFGRNGASAAASVLFSSLAYAAAMAMSSGFATVKVFDVFFTQDERAAWSEQTSEGGVREVLGELAELRETVYASTREQLVEPNGPWSAFERGLASASAREQDLRAERRAEAEAELERRRARDAEQRTFSSNLGLAKQDLARVQAQKQQQEEALAAAKDEMAAWNGEFGELERQITLIDAQIEDEIAGNRTSGKTGCGPVCKELQQQRIPLMAQFDSGPQQQKRLIQQRIDAATKASADLRVQELELDANVRALEAGGPLPEVETPGPADDPVSALAALDSAGDLIQLGARFRENPTQADLDLLTSQCSAVETMPAGEGQEPPRCNLEGALPLAQTLIRLNAGGTFLAQNCNVDTLVQPEGEKRVQFLTRITQECIDKSGLTANATAALRKEVIDIRRNRSETANKFSLIQSALGDGEKLAWLALVIAVFIDALVLFSALLGVLVTLDVMQRAGVTRLEAAALRTALLSRSREGIKATEAAMIVLDAQDGQSIAFPGFTRLNRDKVPAIDQPIFDGIVGAAAGAQTLAAPQDLRNLGWFAMGASAFLLGLWLGQGLLWAAMGGGVIMALYVWQSRTLATVARSTDTHRLVKFDGEPGKPPSEIAISVILLNAMQNVANERQSAQERRLEAVDRLQGKASGANPTSAAPARNRDEARKFMSGLLGLFRRTRQPGSGPASTGPQDPARPF